MLDIGTRRIFNAGEFMIGNNRSANHTDTENRSENTFRSELSSTPHGELLPLYTDHDLFRETARGYFEAMKPKHGMVLRARIFVIVDIGCFMNKS